ncbi:MAG: DUF1592 domain-containing protein [Planctomycetaceae bacterium]|nr:DUF1592 domain-containing protein [Planctomycetaceae bacterium]
MRILILIVLNLALCLSTCGPENIQAANPSSARMYRLTVLPILQSRCFSCHGPKTQEGDIRLDNLGRGAGANLAVVSTWQMAKEMLDNGTMPPEDADQLTDQEQTIISRWIGDEIKRAKSKLQGTAGRVVLRRLNRHEYQNTMRDLFDFDMKYDRDLPPDGLSSDGFRNNGGALQISAIQLEYYLNSARRALDRVIVTGDAPEVFEHKFETSNVGGKWFNYEVSNYLGRWQGFYGKMVDKYPDEGEYLIRVTARAEIPENKGAPLMEVSVGYQPDTEQIWKVTKTIELTEQSSTVYEFSGRVENHPLPVRGQGKFPGLVVRVLNQYDDGGGKPKEVELQRDGKKKKGFPVEQGYPAIHIESVEFKGPIFDQWPPAHHRAILFESDLQATDEQAYVRQVLIRFLKRAYRRPATSAEIQKLLYFFSTIRADFPNFEEAIKETLALSLISPPFLFLLEPVQNKKRELTDWELASRLSYFLWSTMPDEELFELAAAGQLSRPDVLSSQVDRMLRDERGWRFVTQFTDQWLKLENTAHIAIDTSIYRGFRTAIKEEMLQETRHFLRHLILTDRSALNLLDSGFTMLNEPLARHYGVAGVYGQGFREVPLIEEGRGGLLGHSSVLMLGSTGRDSHPIRRAVWIRDRLLNDPPPPPPADVPDLDESNPDFSKLSVREQLEVHRKKESCASCHRAIDPWGIALEHYDAIGKFRTEVNSKPVVATDALPNGQVFSGSASLKQYLIDHRSDDFSRALVARLSIYALGRNLQLSDENMVNDLTQDFIREEHRILGLIKAIVSSNAFRTK